MKKKLLAGLIALNLGLAGFFNANIVEASNLSQSTLDNLADINTDKIQFKIDTLKYMLEKYPRTYAPIKDYAEELIREGEESIRKINSYKARFLVTDNLNIRVKNVIRANLDNRASEFTVNVNSYSSNKQITDWFTETAKEDWYFFYSMYDKASVSTKYNPKKANGTSVYIESATFKVTYREDARVEQEVDDFASDWVLANISTSDSDYDKVLKIHDFIVTQNYYNRGDSQAKSGGYSIYHPASILYGNGGVCNAYATLFDKIASRAGLDVRYATGTSKRNGEPHIWNMVKIDGKWYNIDATWDDPTITFNDGYVENLDQFVIYDYFLKSDHDISASRYIDEDPNRPIAIETFKTDLQNSTIELVDGSYRVIR